MHSWYSIMLLLRWYSWTNWNLFSNACSLIDCENSFDVMMAPAGLGHVPGTLISLMDGTGQCPSLLWVHCPVSMWSVLPLAVGKLLGKRPRRTATAMRVGFCWVAWRERCFAPRPSSSSYAYICCWMVAVQDPGEMMTVHMGRKRSAVAGELDFLPL